MYLNHFAVNPETNTTLLINYTTKEKRKRAKERTNVIVALSCLTCVSKLLFNNSC